MSRRTAKTLKGLKKGRGFSSSEAGVSTNESMKSNGEHKAGESIQQGTHESVQQGTHESVQQGTHESVEVRENGSGAGSDPSLEMMKEEHQKQLQVLEAQVKEKENKYVYLYAEFENFKRRAIKERADLIKFGWEPVARDLLQSVDHLELALQHVPSATDAALVQGLNMVLNEIKATLQKQGVQPIESLKKAFDPNFHEALGQEGSDAPEGTILREHSRGYLLHGRLLRPARVVTSSGVSTGRAPS